MKKLFFLLMINIVCSCGIANQQRFQQAAGEAMIAKNECFTKYQKKEIKTRYDTVQCAANAEIREMGRVNYPHIDILTSLHSKQLTLAQMLDGKEISEAEANNLNAEYTVQFNNQIAEREQSSLERQQAWGNGVQNMLNALAQNQRSNTDVYLEQMRAMSARRESLNLTNSRNNMINCTTRNMMGTTYTNCH